LFFFFAVTVSLLVVLEVFYLIVTSPINYWGCKLVFFPKKALIASRLEISVDKTTTSLQLNCEPQICPPHVTIQSRRQLPLIRGLRSMKLNIYGAYRKIEEKRDVYSKGRGGTDFVLENIDLGLGLEKNPIYTCFFFSSTGLIEQVWFGSIGFRL
jgi:hypothetical protein